MNVIMRAYCPTGTNVEAIQHLMLSHGGYTTTSGMGHWQAPDGAIVAEHVVVYECVANTQRGVEQLDRAGRMYLLDNRKEQAFLGVVISDGVHSIYIEQEKTE